MKQKDEQRVRPRLREMRHCFGRFIYLPQLAQEQLEPQLQVEAPEHPQPAIVMLM
jgi:hypothetical protein